jgi:hypothetical protein
LSSTIATLQGLHLLFSYAGGPHWLLSDEEARRYAAAVQNVVRHYPLHIAEKAQDWFNLTMVVASLEGKRYAEGKRRKAAPHPSGTIGGPLPPGFGPPPPGSPFFSFQPPSPPSRAAPPAAEPYGPPNPAAGEPVH